MNGPPSGFPPGPPTPPQSAPPPPSSAPEPAEPRGGGVPKVLIGAAIVFVVFFGLGLGLVLGGDDDSPDTEDASSNAPVTTDEPAETTAPEETTPSDPSGDSLDDLLSDLPEGFEDMLPDGMLDDLSDLEDMEMPPGMSDVQVTVVFDGDAPDRRIEAIRQEFEDSDLVSIVTFLSAEDMAEISGMTIPPGFAFDTLSAFGAEGVDPEETRDFACSFADDPAVETVQVFGAEPCGTTT